MLHLNNSLSNHPKKSSTKSPRHTENGIGWIPAGSFGEENVVRILWNITRKGLHDLHGHWSFFFSDLTIPLDPQTNESSYDHIFRRFKGYALGVCFFFFFPEVWGGATAATP